MARSEARGNDQIRKVNITRNFNRYAEGSCLVEFGQTKVICTATIDESVPLFLKGKGQGWLTSEYGMLPRSCKTRIQRDKNSGRTYEIQRLIGRALRSVVQLDRIGERTVVLDCDVIQADGGTRTASITGGFVAVHDALSRLVRERGLPEVPVSDFLAAISVGMVGGSIVVDLNYEEDYRADVDMNVVMTGGGEFVEIQGTSEHRTFNRKQMDEMLDLAKKGIGELIDIQRNMLK